MPLINRVYIQSKLCERLANAKHHLSTNQTMNGHFFVDSNYAYHTITNAEFSGVLDRYKVEGYIITGDNPETRENYFSYICDYHLFIKYGDKVYMDVRGVGDIVISFAELQKNKYWKHYYDLSLMLTNHKNLVVEDIEHDDHYAACKHKIYEEERVWSIATAFIDGSFTGKSKKVLENEYNCYYRIDPYDLENMEYSSQQDLNNFLHIYMSRHEVKTNLFDTKSVYYNTFVVDYRTSLIEEEIDDISAIIEDKKEAINLGALFEKHNMNCV